MEKIPVGGELFSLAGDGVTRSNSQKYTESTKRRHNSLAGQAVKRWNCFLRKDGELATTWKSFQKIDLNPGEFSLGKFCVHMWSDKMSVVTPSGYHVMTL